MKKINLRNDYNAIAHPEILKAFYEYSEKTFVGYGLDECSKEASLLIKNEIKNEDADVHFLVGGTITNKILISHVLKPYEAVISPDSGHINVHETGTIEQSGHKIIVTPNYNGKICPKDIEKVVLTHTDEHMVKPKMVYISNPTEFGTVYTKEELQAISDVCRKYKLYFYVDGARLACALTSDKKLSMADLASLVDAFYIGGTKNGLLLGEALVVLNNEIKDSIRYSIKHFGGMYSKGFVNGIQFKTLFENDLFYKIGELENSLAKKLYNELKKLGVKFLMEQETNQIFPIFNNNIIDKLKEEILFEIWEVMDKETVIRFVTGFMTKEEDINNTINVVKKYV